MFALQVNGFVPLMIGATNLMIANPRDIPALVKALRGTPFTVLPGVNTLFNALLNNKDFATLDFSRLHFAIGGGMAVQRTVAERWQAVTGKPLIEAYGLTETSPAAIANPLNVDHFTGAIGLPLPSTEIAIRDDDGRDLAVGETGRIVHQGPAGHGRLLEPAGRDRQGHDRRRLPAHRRHRAGRRARLRVSSSIARRT